MNGMANTIPEEEYRDVVAVSQAIGMERWDRQCNQLISILIEEDWAPQNHRYVSQVGDCHSKLIYYFCISDRINAQETYSNGSVK